MLGPTLPESSILSEGMYLKTTCICYIKKTVHLCVIISIALNVNVYAEECVSFDLHTPYKFLSM